MGATIQPERNLRVLHNEPEEQVSYLTLLKNGNFARFFSAQVVSSLGDWIGVIAIAVYAEQLRGASGVGIVMTARVVPGFIVGPIAGVIADRFNRKRTMVIADIIRGLLLFSLPFVKNLLYLLIVSMVLESLTLVWGPAKDASLPHFVKPSHLTHANSMSLLAIYGPWPLASVVFASLSFLGAFLGEHVEVLRGLQDRPEALALWMDSITFGFSALMISTLAIPAAKKKGGGRVQLGEIKRDLIEGLRFVFTHKQVRPWLIGIGCTFTAAGGVFSLGVTFIKTVLNGSATSFGVVIGFLATGMIVGLLVSGVLAKRIKKDVLFSSALLLLGGSLILFAGMSSLGPAVAIASALGFFGGVAYSTGYSLMQETTEDELRGRTFSAAYTVIRMGTLLGLGLFPLLAGALPNFSIPMFGGSLDLPGSRITLWLAGLVVIGGGYLSMRAIRARRTEQQHQYENGLFVVFEGGEGAGKTTQIEALTKWLEARGEEVVVTREPGGTAIGDRVRKLLLDPEIETMDPRAEALLYAADRAQHVSELIAPALRDGKIVVSDRFLDSSLAYQGLARGLGLDEIYDISQWATGGLVPDVVFCLRIDPKTGFDRLDRETDRLENEGITFHERVSIAYRKLAKQFPDRFVVLDGSRSPAEIHDEVVKVLEERASERLSGAPTEAAPGVPR
ncbi:MAG: dTMP kinase [Actinomycetota bacterium]|nr:dTMP kinase [Actinomycetota bacterium]